MPIDYQIDHARRRVVARGSGTVTETEIFAYQREVWARPEVAGFDQLVDMSAADHIDAPVPSADGMRDLAALAASMDHPGQPSRFAIVAPGDLAFGLGRMYSTYRELDPRSTKAVRVFRTMDEALAWLDGAPDAEP
jgi:hypothetical protein